MSGRRSGRRTPSTKRSRASPVDLTGNSPPDEPRSLRQSKRVRRDKSRSLAAAASASTALAPSDGVDPATAALIAKLQAEERDHAVAVALQSGETGSPMSGSSRHAGTKSNLVRSARSSVRGDNGMGDCSGSSMGGSASLSRASRAEAEAYIAAASGELSSSAAGAGDFAAHASSYGYSYADAGASRRAAFTAAGRAERAQRRRHHTMLSPDSAQNAERRMLNAAVSSSNAELKADQDADYHASVAADQAKREAKKKAAEDQRACELQEAEEKQLEQVMQLSSDAARQEELDRKRQRLSAAATASPLSSSSSMRRGVSAGASSSRAAASADAAGSGGGGGSGSKLGSSSGSSAAATMWQLRIRLPCGKQLERRFDKSETLGVVRDFVDLELAEMKPPSSIKRYTLSTAYPRRTFGPFIAVDTRPAAAQPSEVRMSLAEAGLCSRAALMLHDADA